MDVSTDTQTSELQAEVSRRRTFAIISHPDAGKTTLTEKLLLYSGAVDMAGAVRTRKNQRHATSDWMFMEQERGISITSTVLQFEYDNVLFNLLDTPGHQDFSEDTYRTLTAVDSAVMVLDGAKGIEPQTKKLFEVCRMRHTPILTFINKMDRPAREPLDLLDEIEEVLGLDAAPMNWPIGNGPTFQGVYDLQHSRVLCFERTSHGQYKVPVFESSIDDPKLGERFGEDAYQQLREEVELLQIAGNSFESDRFLSGEMTPVFFGSALSNFGVETFLEALIDLAPSPRPRQSGDQLIKPTQEGFSAFVFKIQANMDPRHRDRVAFARVCSGQFKKDMVVHHSRTEQAVRLNRSYRLFGQERETLEEAFPGDVVGLVNPGLFAIGDTLYESDPVKFDAVPRFHPEHFATLRNHDISKYKQFYKGLDQLREEGVIQVLFSPENVRREPILAAVGELQFDVVVARLASEYRVEASVDRLPFDHARWVDVADDVIAKMKWPYHGTMRLQDADDRWVILFASDWHLQNTQEKNPDIEFLELGVASKGYSDKH